MFQLFVAWNSTACILSPESDKGINIEKMKET